MKSFIPVRYVDEAESVDHLVQLLSWDDARSMRVSVSARDILARADGLGRKTGEIESFLKQYGLDTQEGVALVCLAEALLRVPDAATANELIRDKITAVNWLQGKVQSSDWMVKAARYGLSLTKSTLDGFLSKLGEPVIRQAMIQGIRMLGKQFVLGQTIDEAVKNAVSEMNKGYALSFDMLGEGARTQFMADRYMQAYLHAIDAIGAAKASGVKLGGRTGISVKLSALHPRYTPYQAELCRPVLVERLVELCARAARHDLTLTVDAEETERLTLSLDIIRDVAAHPSLAGWQGFGLAIQAYQKYALDLVDHVIDIARETGRILRVRLVKGAYWDTEVKRAQMMGLPDYPLFTRKANTDLSYLVCAQKMIAASDCIYPMFATHNAHTAAAIIDMVGDRRDGFEFQRLQGMGAPLHDVLTSMGVPTTIYAPVGTHEDLLAYLVRRLLENGANTSFVNQLNRDAGTDVLVADPVRTAQNHPTRRHKMLPLPRDIYGDTRLNSRGLDLAQADEFAALLVPQNDVVTVSVEPNADMARVDDAVKRAHVAFPAWNDTPASTRADILNRFADLLEAHMAPLMRLCVKEGLKTTPDALAEVREAVDFARYYAAQARAEFHADGTALPGPTGESNRLLLLGRGVFACISPWNFPLAIFTGQVVAALAAGNSVVAKPAEQTPEIAAYAVELLYRAGVPRDALHLLIGDGVVGTHIIRHPLMAGVAFTGSGDVARIINCTLAMKEGPIVPLIAETGGQNAMIVDSTALLEQVCDDVIISAFGSAGQRCSALRVLYIQNDIADHLIDLIKGAVASLRVGDPGDFATDVGPVIDRESHAKLITHQEFLKQIGGRDIAQAWIDPAVTAGRANLYFFAPSVYEIGSIRDLQGEVFGPILHIVRFDASQLDQVIADINATGYGLTFGLHTRIDGRMDTLAKVSGAGNVYINRTMIGAVVGVQPFGGRGLSGTGPKAGGPHYLHRFATEKVISRNTAASGGNVALVAGGD